MNEDINPKLIINNQGLSVNSIGKSFNKRPIVREVSLKIQRGEAIGLLGPNGAGKTTCFYIVVSSKCFTIFISIIR